MYKDLVQAQYYDKTTYPRFGSLFNLNLYGAWGSAKTKVTSVLEKENEQLNLQKHKSKLDHCIK